MNKNERRILGTALRAAASWNREAWCELKREMFDRGYQPYYHAQSDFLDPVKRAVSMLATERKMELADEWSKRYAPRTNPSEEQLIEHYGNVMLEEILRRAWIAAYRTENW